MNFSCLTFKALDFVPLLNPSTIFAMCKLYSLWNNKTRFYFQNYTSYFFPNFSFISVWNFILFLFYIILIWKKSQQRTDLFPEIIWKGVQRLETGTYNLELIWHKCLNNTTKKAKVKMSNNYQRRKIKSQEKIL